MRKRKKFSLKLGVGVAVGLLALGVVWDLVQKAPKQKAAGERQVSSSLPDYQTQPAEFQQFLQREIPEVIAAVKCHCGCNQTIDKCYEGHCPLTCRVCNGSGKIAYELHQKGKSIEEIQDAVDREFARL